MFTELNHDQSKIFIDTAQLHESVMDTMAKQHAYRGGMHWKKAKGRQYLFRTTDRFGNGKSLGPRSAENEKKYLDFHRKKEELDHRLSGLKDELKQQARFCKAAQIARVPRIVTAILRLLEQKKMLGKNLRVIGTNALYAYEASAGVFFETRLLATRDMDILWDVKTKLNLYTLDSIDDNCFISLLKKADRSFEIMDKESFRAVNQKGYMVDLVKPEPKSVLVKEVRKIEDNADLVAAEIKNLQWLVSSPKLTQVIIGDDGFPAKIVVPDPRAFALHKLWLSNQKDREPIKRKRDADQAASVCKLILEYLPMYSFKPEELKMFPKKIVEDSLKTIKNSDLPPGY